MRVTDVIRGEDLVNVTPKYLLLRRALGAPVDDLRFAHLPLIVNEQRKKLSKRRDDVSLLDYRDRGFLGEAMVNYLALLGWGPPDGVEVRTDPLAEFPPVFRIADVGESSATFDVAKLRHVDAEHIRALGSAHFLARARPFLEAAPWADRFRDETFAGIADEVQVRVETLDEVPDLVEFLFVEDPPVDETAWEAAMADDAAAWLRTLAERMAEWPWRSPDLHERTTALADELGVKLRRFQTPLRVALTGRRVGLPLFESMEVLGRDECLRRVGAALDRLGDAGS
jgi:glutamyl-tRNA synthetase